MIDSVIIRPACLDDIATITALEQQLFSHPHTLSQLNNMIGERYIACVALIKQVLVGYAISSFGGGDGDLLVIAVDENHQRQGLAGKLLDWQLTALKQQEVDCLFLEVRASNAAAIAFYQCRGFEGVGERRNYYRLDSGQREDALLFCFSLGAS